MNNNFKKEIFDKSPIGFLFYDKNSFLNDANNSAMQILGTHSSDVFRRFNLYDNPVFNIKKKEIIKK